MRRHRLAERFLTDILGLSWADAHAEAGKWEHVISEPVEAAMTRVLGDPTTCPHGNPIPGSDYDPPDAVTLDGARAVGSTFTVSRIPEELEFAPGLLEFLEESAVVPGQSGTVTAASPDGTTTVEIDGRPVGIGPAPGTSTRSGSPAPTPSPAPTRTSPTVPSTAATTACSIFIDSMTTSVVPSWTPAPVCTRTPTTRPCRGDTTSCTGPRTYRLPSRRPDGVPDGAGRGRAGPAADLTREGERRVHLSFWLHPPVSPRGEVQPERLRSADLGGAGGVVAGDDAVDDGADDGADDRGHPEQPELLERPAADEQRRPGASGPGSPRCW